jgi:CRISPR-associated protein Csd1
VLEEAVAALPEDDALNAVVCFYRQYGTDFRALLDEYRLWHGPTLRTGKEASVLASNDRFAFTLDTDLFPAFERPALKAYWRRHYRERLTRKAQGAQLMKCLSCGTSNAPVSNHERTIKNIPEGHKKGVKLISFNRSAFRSHGLDQSRNAPMCQPCVEAYTLGLNRLLENGASTNYKDHDAKMAYAFWSRKPVEFDLNATFVQADANAVKGLYDSLSRPSQRQIVSEGESNDFYVLALSASGARAVIRDWIETQLGTVRRNIAEWFQDLTISLDRPWPSSQPRAALPGIYREFSLRSLCKSISRKTERGWDVPSELSSRLFRAGLTGCAPPIAVLAAALRRVRSSRDHDIPPPRAALIKLVLNRISRSPNQGDNRMSESLDPKKSDIAYVCGRLLAILDRIQRRALGNLNATVIDRYYGSASTAPRPIFPRLITNAQNHLSKIRGERPGEAENLQKDLEQVIARIGIPDDWAGDLPQWLDLEAQGRFAIGFYHQRADYRARFAKSEFDKFTSQPGSTTHNADERKE